jgi:mRNA interferase RelE/StbE
LASKIEYTDSALKQLKKLDKQISRQILNYLDANVAPLADPKTLGKELTGTLGTFWRYRIGDYRAICHIETDSTTVLVLQVSHRSTVYDDEKKIARKAQAEIEEFQSRKTEDNAVENEMQPDFHPTSTGELKLGGLKTFNVNFVHDTRFTVPIALEHHSFESLDSLKQAGEWKDIKLSSIAIQLKDWPKPKVRTYSFLGKVIKAEKGDGETLVTLDKFGEVTLVDIEV